MSQNVSGVHEKATPVLGRHQVAVNLKRNNLHAIRSVIDAGESLSEFVRVAVLAEISRRRDEESEAIPCDGASKE